MSLRCLLAFTACLNTQGVTIPGNQAVDLLDSCQVAQRYSVSQFEGHADQGNIHLEILLDHGLPGYEPANTAALRRANLLKACDVFLRDFNNDRKWVAPANRGSLWWLNLLGIGFEIAGATLIVIAALRNRGRIKSLEDTWNGGAVEKLRDVVAGQAITELRGFVFLAVGLFMQLIGTLVP